VESWWDVWKQLLWQDGRVTSMALAAVAGITLLELLVPAEPDQGMRGRARNLVYLLYFKVLGLGAMALWFAFGPPPAYLVFEAPAYTTWLLVLANLFVFDFLYYWYHRAQHRFQALWAIHELHHADTELNATTSYRTYWLEALVQLILVSTATHFLFGGLGAWHTDVVIGLTIFFLLFGHANLRLSLGPLSGVLCGPQVHRIHHSRIAEHQDRNFAQIFPLIDRIFGTYHAPRTGEFPPTGAQGLASDAPIIQALVQPLRIWASAFRAH